MPSIFSWREAIQTASLPSTTKLVLLNLSIYMNEKGEGCYPSVKRQASDTNLSEKTICDHLQKAAAAGFIYISKQRMAGQQWALNSYRAIFPDTVVLYGAADARANEFVDSKALTFTDEGTYPDGQKALTEVQSTLPMNSPENSPTKKIKVKKAMITLQQWEYDHGSALDISMMQDWVTKYRLDPMELQKLIGEFRIDMMAKGKLYADFKAAFMNYLMKGWLSRTMAQIPARAPVGGSNQTTRGHSL